MASAEQFAVEQWRHLSQNVLSATDPFERHETLFNQTYAHWPTALGPPPAVFPPSDAITRSNVGRWITELGLHSFEDLHAYSVREPERFLRDVVTRLGIRFQSTFTKALDLSLGIRKPVWFTEAKLNIVDSLFAGNTNAAAIIFRKEGHDALKRISVRELDELSARFANGLLEMGFVQGDAIGMAMPMTPECVTAYLGIIRAGMTVVSIADSFAPPEIESRLNIGEARAIVTQDVILRDGKSLPLYERIQTATAIRTIVVPAGESLSCPLRSTDRAFSDCLSSAAAFENVATAPSDAINILFSSGTTGKPKAIPWDQTTPIRCALDGYVHQDVQPGDVVAWPTNIGWMMGPWLIFASLANRAAMALYDGAPNGRGFCQFVQDAKVSVLGVVPSLVRAWRSGRHTDGLDWSAVKAFSSTGEASDAGDMLWLMSRAGYKPVIEYCGGTEIGGAYISSTPLDRNSPAHFSAKTLGMDFVILDDNGHPADEGELFLVPPSLGQSTRLLNADHDEIYFKGCPIGPAGQTLRRHGDQMKALPSGFYRALGRADDTMNLGGIKVSAVELERTLNLTPGVIETAAVGVSPDQGGPSLLEVYAVVDRFQWKDHESLRSELQNSLRRKLNPLFKIHGLHITDVLPRTASNKVMRRVLRQTLIEPETKTCSSPNADERPPGTKIDTVVLHATVLPTLQEVIDHFTDASSRVSAHYTIDRDGTIVSHVPEEQRAWHAGKSKMKDGRESVNDFSIGIELVNLNDGVDPYPEAQLEALRRLLRTLLQRWPIRHVIPHYECADPPGRKSDPRGYDDRWVEGLL